MVDPLHYDATLLAASLHVGGYQQSVARFAREHSAALSSGPSAFVSVSLSAAGNDPSDHAAGAFAYTRYNLLVRWYMKRIARQRGVSTDTSRDCEFTDYTALRRFADQFLAAALHSNARTTRPGWAAARWAL